MTPFLFKIAQGSLFLVLYLLIYQLILSRYNAFKWHRFSLLILPLIAFVVPFLMNNSSTQSTSNLVFNLAPALVTTEKPTSIVQNYSLFTMGNILFFLWFFVAFCLFILLIAKVIHLYNHFPAVAKRSKSGIIIHYDTESKNAWTFFNHIVLSNKFSKEEQEIILMHERAHAKQHHSWDVLYAGVIKCLFWWHPFIYLWDKDIKENHEYLADAAVTKEIEVNKYCELIVNKSFDTQNIQLANTFFYNKSNLIKRIVMMKKNQKFGKYVTLFGTLCVFVAFVGFTYQQSGNVNFSNEVKQKPIAKRIQNQSPPDSVYKYVKNMPKFPGGQAKMYAFLVKNTHYPESEFKDSIQGKVYVTFVVTKKGNLTHIKIKKGFNEDFNNEALRVVKSMPKWKPGRMNGKKVNVRVILPFNFTF